MNQLAYHILKICLEINTNNDGSKLKWSKDKYCLDMWEKWIITDRVSSTTVRY